ELSNALAARTSAYRRLWLETAFWEVTHPVNLTGNAQTGDLAQLARKPRLWIAVNKRNLAESPLSPIATGNSETKIRLALTPTRTRGGRSTNQHTHGTGTE